MSFFFPSSQEVVNMRVSREELAYAPMMWRVNELGVFEMVAGAICAVGSYECDCWSWYSFILGYNLDIFVISDLTYKNVATGAFGGAGLTFKNRASYI